MIEFVVLNKNGSIGYIRKYEPTTVSQKTAIEVYRQQLKEDGLHIVSIRFTTGRKVNM
jgi:hypothetical protein